MESFWKPAKKVKPYFGAPRLSSYTKRTAKEWKVIDKNPYGDTDHDKVMNWFDCKPLDFRFDAKFSYSKAVPEKPIKDPRVKRLLKSMKRPVKAVEVSDLRGPGNNPYMGAAIYKQNKIIVDNKLSKKDKYETIVHEIGHYKMRQKKPVFGKGVMREIKKHPLYKEFKKEGYVTKKIPEELFTTFYTQYKTQYDENKLQKFRRKYPETAKKFVELADGRRHFEQLPKRIIHDKPVIRKALQSVPITPEDKSVLRREEELRKLPGLNLTPAEKFFINDRDKVESNIKDLDTYRKGPTYSKVIGIRTTQENRDFLKKHNISPSLLFRTKLNEIRANASKEKSAQEIVDES